MWDLWKGTYFKNVIDIIQGLQVPLPWIRGSLKPMALTAQEAGGDSPVQTQIDWRDLSKSKAPLRSELNRNNGLVSWRSELCQHSSLGAAYTYVRKNSEATRFVVSFVQEPWITNRAVFQKDYL